MLVNVAIRNSRTARVSLLALLVTFSITATHDVRAAAQLMAQPDVQVLIMHDPGGQDMVDLTYPLVVPQTQAQADVANICKLTRLSANDIEITNAAVIPKEGESSAPMTSATFSAAGAVPVGQTAFRIEPWIVALRRYKSIALTYIVPPNFVFNGLQTYKDNHIELALDRRGGTITYRVNVLNSNFDHLNLPLTQTAAATIQRRADERRDYTFRVLAVLLISVAAAGVGYAVYTLISRVA